MLPSRCFHRSFVAYLTLLVLAIAAGCEPAAETPSAATFVDDLERDVTTPRPIERVVTLAPNLTEIVFAASAGHKLVGVTTADDYPPAVDSLARFSALPIDFEAITALRPQLVLATDQVNSPRDAATFASLDIPVYFFSFRTVDDVLRSIRTTGRLLGTEDAARTTADALQASLDRLRAWSRQFDHPPRVLFLIGDDTLYAFGATSYIHTLIELAGGQSITADITTKSPTLSEEYVLTHRPDVIIGAFGSDYDPERLLELHPSWNLVPAIQHGRVYSLPPDLVLRPGPRLVAGALRMAQLLHPSRADSLGAYVPPAQPAGHP